MRAHRTERHHIVSDFIRLGPPVAERMQLEIRPGAEVVASYVLMGAAERAWEAINRQLAEPSGALFWILGPAGTGKTHFLNYVLALQSRAGAPTAANARELTATVGLGRSVSAVDFERQVLEALSGVIVGEQRGTALWRQLKGAGALNVLLDQARRTGVRSVTLFLDFGETEGAPTLEYLAVLAEAAAHSRNLRFTIISAARWPAPEGALAFEVDPVGPEEKVVVAVGRARSLLEDVAASVESFYAGVDTGGFEPRLIFPFHPAAVDALRAVATPPGTVAALAGLMREVLAAAQSVGIGALRRLVYPADLMAVPEFAGRTQARLGEAGCAALGSAYRAAERRSEHDRSVARQLVDTLALGYLSDATARFSVPQLAARLPEPRASEAPAHRAPSEIGAVLHGLAARSQGVIEFEQGAARFEPQGAGAPEVAAFKAALSLIRRFDPALEVAEDLSELNARLARLGEVMANMFEAAHRTAEILASAAREAQSQLSADDQKTLSDFIALVGGGPRVLLEVGADPARLRAAIKTAADFEALAATAAAVPRIRTMRDYLRSTGLKLGLEDDPSKDARLAALETECQLLTVALNPGASASARRNLDALEARFQKFKWTYIEQYWAAHERWRRDIEKLMPVHEDARRHLDALERLNTIAALGAPEGEGLEAEFMALSRRIVRCDFYAPLALELQPRCPQCNFTLGETAPAPELDALLEKIRSALRAKLATLSQSAIARLIRQHDQNHRLEGFLKITQAAHTDALIRVLDDELARYLARLLEEGAGQAASKPPASAVVRRIGGSRFKNSSSKTAAGGRPTKTTAPHDGER